MKAEVKRLTATEDGSIALKPAQKVVIKVVWMLMPVYEEEYKFYYEFFRVFWAWAASILDRIEGLILRRDNAYVTLSHWTH